LHVIALAPEGPPLSIRDGTDEFTVVAVAGPERIGPEWWQGDHETRDYFAVGDARGRWWWVYRTLPTNAWFLHGTWT
jgi:protein ImuB